MSSGIERDNLFLEVRECAEPPDKAAALRAALRGTEGGAVVYCAAWRAATEVHGRLRQDGIAAELVHPTRRGLEHEGAARRFAGGESRVLVATSGAGTELDRPDLRLVVHWDLPDSVEIYRQEVGRAGRDGRPATALLLYRPEDRRIQSFFTGGRHPPREELRAIWGALDRAGTHPTALKRLAAEAGLTDRRAQLAVSLLRSLGLAEKRGGGFRRTRAFASAEEWDAFLSASERSSAEERDRLRAMVRYAQTALCRRQALRTALGETTGEPCGRCDNCRDRPQVTAQVLRRDAGARPGAS